MLHKKNITPLQLSFLIAFILSVTISIGVYIYSNSIQTSTVFFAFIFVGSSALIYYLFDIFIHRQIKLIYKFISQTKASKREEFYFKNILPPKSIEEAQLDVEKWALQQKKEFEALQKNEVFRKEFLQNLSHELKTPIFSIQGYVETLLNGAVHNNEVNIRFLQNASKNIERLVSLVDDLDEISKLESGELQLSCTNFIIQDLIKEVFEELSFKLNEKSVSCTIKKGCEMPLMVHADKEKIRQVLINLVDNAIKYGKSIDGVVEASFYKVNNGEVLIEISDNGSGIADEHKIRIFERFYRTDSARSRKAGGSGLGLAICKHIIEAHQQAIHVRSTIDVGTTFGFSLPSAK